MKEMTRAQSVQMWEYIADGVFNDVGSYDKHGDYDPPWGCQVGAYDFIVEVAQEVLAANKLPSKKRPEALMKALRLDGREIKDELAKRNAIEFASYFPPTDDDGNLIPVPEAEMRQRILMFYRKELGFKKPGDDETPDDERLRQIREFMKNNQL